MQTAQAKNVALGAYEGVTDIEFVRYLRLGSLHQRVSAAGMKTLSL
jgi:hypothetical protein